MLDCPAETVPTVDQVYRLPCSVKLPATPAEGFEQKGIAPALPGCKRRYQRIRCRGQNVLVALQHQPILPALPRSPAWFAGYLTDIGKGGLGFLHGEPLFPKERLRVVLSDEKQGLIEIIRCERLGERCFGLGARFVEQQ